jgi:hypothetical protein
MSLFLFFDEAGDLNFKDSGSSWYLFGVLTTPDPAEINHRLTDLRYDLISEGTELRRFHASEDMQAVRDRVYPVLQNCGDYEYHAVVLEKRKTHPSIREPLVFYPRFAEILLKFVFDRHPGQERLCLITDELPVKQRKKAWVKAFKLFVGRHLGSRPYTISHHSSLAHPGLQAADYLNWALFRKWEREDTRSYDLIADRIGSEFEVFRRGVDYYY